MALVTPGAKNHAGLAPLASRYVTVDDLPWVKTRWPGVEIKVVDADTKQVIRQIPSEEMLVLNKRLQELGQAKGSGISLRGLLFDEQA